MTAASASATERASVLLVEDDESVRQVLHKALTRKGYLVLEAANGAHALEMIEGGEAIDVVVSDVVMPKMGGFELAQQLSQRHSSIKVLLISGYTQSDGGLAGNPLLSPGTHFLRKPFSTDLLDETIRGMLAE